MFNIWWKIKTLKFPISMIPYSLAFQFQLTCLLIFCRAAEVEREHPERFDFCRRTPFRLCQRIDLAAFLRTSFVTTSLDWPKTSIAVRKFTSEQTVRTFFFSAAFFTLNSSMGSTLRLLAELVPIGCVSFWGPISNWTWKSAWSPKNFFFFHQAKNKTCL